MVRASSVPRTASQSSAVNRSKIDVDKQKTPCLVVEGIEDLGGQIVGDVTVVCGELPNSSVGVSDPGQPQSSEPDSRRPALGPLDESLDLDVVDRNTCPAEHCAGLVNAEREVARAEFAQRAPRAEPAQPPARIRAGRGNDPNATGQPLDDIDDRPQARFAECVVEVVEHDGEASACRGRAR